VTTEPDALERMGGLLRDSILTSHAEKHTQEQKAIDKALEAAEKSEGHHRNAHTEAHTAHEKIHDVASQAHREQHAAEATAVSVAVAAMDRRLNDLGSIADRFSPNGQYVSIDAHRAELRTLEARINTVEKVMDRQEGAVNTWRWIAGFLGVGGIGAIVFAIVNRPLP